MLGRACLVTAVLWALPALAQNDQCQEQCGNKMATCAMRCGENAGCANNCSSHYTDCAGRCAAAGKKGTPAAPKGLVCVNAKGKPERCPDPAKSADARKIRNFKEDPDDKFPNKAAKDLMKDPNFKVIPQGAQ